MAQNIYAFLVGIDSYPAPIHPLKGCVNDVRIFADYLKGRIHSDDGGVGELYLKLLTNEEATREALIQGFRNHLGQATQDDVVLFYYSGHGSQEQAPEEFWTIEPDRLNETLVCWDSRLDGHWDLADKELAVLIDDVAKSNPQITIILDCCHSGSGTRNLFEVTGTRRAPTDNRIRPLNTFLCSLNDIQQLSTSRSPEQNPSGWNLPCTSHILMAACRDHEEAKEFYGEGQHRGAFSYFLMETLQKASSNLTYRDLFKRTNAIIHSRVSGQSPQSEATVSADLERFFLGGAIANSPPYFTVTHHPAHGWVIDGGAVHGLTHSSETEPTLLALFPFDSSVDHLKDIPRAIATARVKNVLPQLSTIEITDGQESLTDPSDSFKAVVISVPLPTFTVSLEGEMDGIQWLRQALSTASPAGQPSLYVRESEEAETGSFRLIATDNHYLLTRMTGDRPLNPEIPGYSLTSAKQAIQSLEHIARWNTVAELESPSHSRIPAHALTIDLYSGEDDKEQAQVLNQAQVRMAYTHNSSQQTWTQPTFRVKLTNNSDEILFCALYDLTERFKVQSILDGGTVRLEPKQQVWVLGGQVLYGSVPQSLWKQGITEYRDIFKVIACTAEFDATLMEQGEIGSPLPSAARSATRGTGTLNRLMKRVITRDIGLRPEEEELYDDWITSQVTFTFVRPQEAAQIHSEQSISLGAGVSVASHPTLQANARLTTVTQATRDLGNHLYPAIFRDRSTHAQPLQFTSGRGTDPGLSALELTNVADPTVVTHTHPLAIAIDQPLESNEHVLPFAYEPPVLNKDGSILRDGFFMPLGYGKAKNEGIEVILERLPSPTSEGTRSLHGSIRIFFQKVVAEKLGLEFPYPLLSAVDFADDGTIKYDADRSNIQQRVADATTIVLYIHGIIGDTESMVPSAKHACIQHDDAQRSLIDVYDLILTFDYENLNTPIGDVAEQLRDALASVGLGSNHSQQLHIVAHSMGGLIARSFIEQKGGNQVVQHLIMCGTPNGGSPWSTLQDWVTTALTIGINSLSTIAFPIRIIGNLIAAIELIDISLDQMKPGSDFLKSLKDSPDPNLHYTIIAGNTSIIQSETQSAQNRMIAILNSIGRYALEFPFMSQPNDIAATVHSIRQIPEGRSPQPNVLEVACHHLVYFTHPEGLKALSTAVINTGILSTQNSLGNRQAAGHLRLNVAESKKMPFWLLGLTVLILFGAIVGVWVWSERSNNLEQKSSDNESLVVRQSLITG